MAIYNEGQEERLRAIADCVRPVLSRHPVKKAYVFGSQARGDQRPDSDVDFYCSIDRSRPFGMFALGALYHDLQEALGSTVDIVTAEGLEKSNPRLYREIERDKVLVYERTADR